MKFSFTILFIVASLHCSAADQFKASKIVDSATISSVLRTASAGLQMRPPEAGGTGGSGIFRARLEDDVALECDERTRRDFMLAFRSASQKLLGDQGATIHGWGKQGSDEDLRGFSWEYSWGANN